MLDRSPTPPSSDAARMSDHPPTPSSPEASIPFAPIPLTPVPVTGRTGARPGY